MVKILFLAFFIVLLSSSQGFADIMKVVYFNQFAPISWEAEDGRMQGILVDIISEAVGRRMHIKPRHLGYPWLRAQSMVASGDADAFLTVPTPKRSQYTVIGKEPVLQMEIHLFVRNDHPKKEFLTQIQDITELKPYRLVNYIGNGWAKKKLQGLNVTWLRSLDQVPPFLMKERADIWVHNAIAAPYLLHLLGYQDSITMLPRSLSTISFHLCIGKDSPFASKINEFDRIIREMKGDGSLKAIFAEYHAEAAFPAEYGALNNR